MSVAIVTGSAGLIGSDAVTCFANSGFDIIDIDNNMRQYFLGAEASTRWRRNSLHD